MSKSRRALIEEYLIEPLGPHHGRGVFSCGEQPLDDYLKRRASQDVKKNAAAVFVARRGDSTAVAAYYTLSSTAVPLDELPPGEAKRLPRYPLVPATLLGRLAVDTNHQCLGLGEHLLMDALYRSFRQGTTIASAALVVDAKHYRAREFYQRYHFIAFPDRPLRLFLPMTTIRGMFGGALPKT